MLRASMQCPVCGRSQMLRAESKNSDASSMFFLSLWCPGIQGHHEPQLVCLYGLFLT